MKYIFILFLLAGNVLYAQQHEVTISVGVLKVLAPALKNEQIHVVVINKPHVLDTNISYPFTVPIKFTTSEDSLFIVVRTSLPTGVENLRKSFSANAFYITKQQAGKQQVSISFPQNCAYNISFQNRLCPICKRDDEVIPIIYGLPIFNRDGTTGFDNIEYYPGGCEVSGCDPTWYCKRDKYTF